MQNTENFETEPLDDPDERVWTRIEKGLEKDLTFDEFMYSKMEHALKELAKKRGWTWR